MTPPFKIVLVAALVGGCALLASCDSDPLRPSGTYVPPTYTATIESMRSNFRNVCGNGPDDIYVAGPALLHYDGSQWAPVGLPGGLRYIDDVRMLSDGSLAVRSSDELFVLSDGVWSSTGEAPNWPHIFWGRSRDDLYGCAWDQLYHYDGAGWSAVSDAPIPADLRDMSGNSDGKLVMSGWAGRLDTFDGTEWTSLNLDSLATYYRVVVTPSGRIFVAGTNNMPDGWRSVLEIIDSTPVRILDNVDVETLQSDGEKIYVAAWADGENRPVAREYAAGVWRDIARIDTPFNDVCITGEEVFAAAYETIWHGNASGGDETPAYPYLGRMEDAVAIGDAIYAVGEVAYRYQDGEWTDLRKQLMTLNTAYSIDGRVPTNIYAVGDHMVLHYDGTRWQWINSGLENRLNAVWVDTDGSVVAVGGNGDYPVVVDYDGKEWTEKEIPLDSYSLNDVVRIGNTIYTCGNWGLVGRREGHVWYFSRPTNASVYALWGSDEQHVYAATSRPNEILFYDGSRWKMKKIDGPRIDRAVSVWGTSPSNVFVLDQFGSLARFDGSAWSGEGHFLTDMRAIAGTRRELLVVGAEGAVSYRK